MGLATTLAVALVGVRGHCVQVEAHVSAGLPAFVLVGLPDASLNESRDRVRAAAANSGCKLPQARITVNLSPATLPKAGSSFDLAVAVAVLAAAELLPAEPLHGVVHLGELGLDGRLRGVRGVLPAVLAAAAAGVTRVVVPLENAAEASLVPDIEVTGAGSLAAVIAAYQGKPIPSEGRPAGPGAMPRDRRTGQGSSDAAPTAPPDLADVRGQVEARMAVEVAAAGGHHLLLLGPPGAGKTMLASRLPGLLPDLPEAQALEVTAVHSLAGTLHPDGALMVRPPFEDPHHTSTVVSIVGGGSGLPRPGAASRAHHGVLFLDEAPEFETRVLDALRQPLESGELVIHRSLGTARYPARFQLLLAANPCPCGRSSGQFDACRCSPLARRRYLRRLSGPLLDRVDLQVEVRPVSRVELAADRAPEPTQVVAARVRAARDAQRQRLAPLGYGLNGDLPGTVLRGVLRLPRTVTAELDRALDRGVLSVRGWDRSVRAAWTLADLEGRARPGRDHVARALSLRQLGPVAA